MRISLFLIISIYFVAVNCISKRTCLMKCSLTHSLPLSKFEVIVLDNVCICTVKLGSYEIKQKDFSKSFCKEKHHTDSYNSLVYLGAFNNVSFDCLHDYKCDEQICHSYCYLEYYPHGNFSSSCYEGYECKCQNASESCILSKNEDNSIIEYHPQNNIAINDILFNLKNLNPYLCPLKSDKDSKLNVVNGTVITRSNITYSYNECKVMCELNNTCDRCFDCYSKP